jgi:catechol 2,3-dioxygenase-like lactoylglutathione lyase family enzyme
MTRMETVDHMGFNVKDFETSKRFYLQALEPLGIQVVRSGDGWAMLGRAGRGQFWFGSFGPAPGPLHLAFCAADREQVRAFHAAALTAGARDNGPPGLRPQYHASYYAAFVIDPDGHNIEAVCHKPE